MDSLSVGHWVLLGIFIAIVATTLAVTYFIEEPEDMDQFEKEAYQLTRSDSSALLKREKDFYVIAHRGAKSDYPENTMPAFKAAHRVGADMIELDVQLSKDGIPVVFHDKKLARTTNGKGKVSAFSLEELKKLDAGSWFAKQFTDVRIPTLEEVLQWSRDKIPLNIELKAQPEMAALPGGLEEKCINLVKKYAMEGQVLFSSFNYESIRHIRNLNPGLNTGVLYNWRKSGDLLPSELVARFGVNTFHCSKDKLNERWVQNLTDHNIPLLVYTVNRKRTMKRIYRQGARGIISDKPALLKQVTDSLSR